MSDSDDQEQARNSMVEAIGLVTARLHSMQGDREATRAYVRHLNSALSEHGGYEVSSGLASVAAGLLLLASRIAQKEPEELLRLVALELQDRGEEDGL